MSAAAAAAIMMAAAMCGCGKSSGASSSTSESKPAQSAESGAAEGGNESGGEGLKEFTTACDGTAKVTVEGDKFMAGGKEIWFNGVNTPWDKWNDFGGGFNFEFWQDHFAKLHDAGVNASRIWICCNGDVGMEISPDGTFTGATTAHWEDLDDLFFLAESYNIYIMATVQSFDHYKDTNQNYKAWRELIQSDEKTDQYIDNYIIPLVKRYDACDYLWSIDLCNEPDWIIEEDSCGKLKWDGPQKYYAKACSAIHANSDVLVTVGMGMIKYNSDSQVKNVISDEALQGLDIDWEKYDKDKAYVDFWSTHWYAWMIPNWGVIYEHTPGGFGLTDDRPSVIGEMPAADPKYGDEGLTGAYEEAYQNGFRGVFAWKSSGSDDGCGLWKDIEPTIRAMLEAHEDEIFPLGKK
ncbi:MAG: cellulase (glycosyl hydrolase family 5) [Ruminococcus sp.]|nr:cellulase (glycosyl hydrolase family 5) [Ruminococcus sp.]